MMISYSKYAKTAVSLAVSLVVALVAEGTAVKDTMLVKVMPSEPSGIYEKVAERKSESFSKNTVSVEKKSSEKTVKRTSEKATEKATQKATEKASEKATQKATEKATEKATQKATEKATEKATQKATEKASEKAAQKATEKSAQKATEKATEKATQKATEKVTEKASFSETKAKAKLYAEAPTEEATYPEKIVTAASANIQYEAGYLIPVANPDYEYSTGQVTLSDADRKLACQIVYGEAGGEGFEGCCLVAQCLKDSMVFLGYNSMADVQKYCRYDGWQENYSQTAEDAVNYIFDQNRSAVAHRILFFYATNICKSEWHETQNDILTRGNSRFFDMW